MSELDAEAGFITQWFADADALAAFEAWERDASDVVCDRAKVVVAEEVVQRGEDWLERRWAEGGRKWKHVALARRRKGVGRSEFSARWRGHAGSATTGTAGAVPIPNAARGLAYVQNHPLAGNAGDWVFDAITEVWFDDLSSMQARIDWFKDNVVMDDLFGAATFLAVTEDVLGP